ncbi:unnamed protein product [Bemisia tabaci]|uniref:Uncharacterized protein n=1 Tax=Bemisia tabaci TaxID=7038 RepID=A0A9P0CGM9_BEMTA|nr:unnamed protein product [Bemisia tabaci]
MLSFQYVLVCGLIAVDFSKAMLRSRIRGMRIVSDDTPPQEGALPLDPAADNAALHHLYHQQDPCWNAPHNPGPNHEASRACQRAFNAFNLRPLNLRDRCPFAEEPKCRYFGSPPVKYCSVKKRRPAWCAILGFRHEVVKLSHCARPVFPGVVPAIPHLQVPPVVVLHGF